MKGKESKSNILLVMIDTDDFTTDTDTDDDNDDDNDDNNENDRYTQHRGIISSPLSCSLVSSSPSRSSSSLSRALSSPSFSLLQ